MFDLVISYFVLSFNTVIHVSDLVDKNGAIFITYILVPAYYQLLYSPFCVSASAAVATFITRLKQNFFFSVPPKYITSKSNFFRTTCKQISYFDIPRLQTKVLEAHMDSGSDLGQYSSHRFRCYTGDRCM